MTTTRSTEKTDALDQLREIFPPGSTARTILRHVARSGMSRAISVVTPDAVDVSYLLAQAGIAKPHPRYDGLNVGGCGMDMGFKLVYDMSRDLYPQGFECTGDRCPSNDHSNGDRDYTPGHVVHLSGGYAVSQRWL